MIIDAFIFCNELDLLEIRLNELNDVVDRFILIESTYSFSGYPKPPYFHENREWYAKFLPKIDHVLLQGINAFDPWSREHTSRNAIDDRIKDCAPDDIIMLSDVDEIPSRAAVATLRPDEMPRSFSQRFCYYWVNCTCWPIEWWAGTKAYRKDQWVTGSCMRFIDNPGIPQAGWHFSYLGGVEAIKAKLTTFAHTELCNEETFARLPGALAGVVDFLGRDLQWKIEPFDSLVLPQHLVANRDRFAHFIHD